MARLLYSRATVHKMPSNNLVCKLPPLSRFQSTNRGSWPSGAIELEPIPGLKLYLISNTRCPQVGRGPSCRISLLMPIQEQWLLQGTAGLAATYLSVIVPAAKQGILTGMILGVARVAGEAAPLLFTSLNNQYWATKLGEPTAALPVMIYKLAISPYDDWHRQAWAAGLVLLVLVLLANIASRWVLSRGASAQRG